MITLLLACTHTPPQLFPVPVEPRTFPPVVLVEAKPEDVSMPLAAGQPAPGRGVLVPPRRLSAFVAAEDHRDEHLRALRTCETYRVEDRARADREYGALDKAAARNATTLKAHQVAWPVSIGLAFIKGTLVPIGYRRLAREINP